MTFWGFLDKHELMTWAAFGLFSLLALAFGIVGLMKWVARDL